MDAIIKRLQSLSNVKEGITGGFNVINSDHKLIHDGYGFEFATEFTIAGSASAYIGITTSADRFAHVKSLVLGVIGNSVDIQWFIDSTFTGGTAMGLYNHNHNSAETADMVMVKSPTVSDDGDAKSAKKRILSDATNINRTSSQLVTNPDQEYVFKDNETKYLLKLTNTDTGDTRVSVEGFFYEETQGVNS